MNASFGLLGLQAVHRLIDMREPFGISCECVRNGIFGLLSLACTYLLVEVASCSL